MEMKLEIMVVVLYIVLLWELWSCGIYLVCLTNFGIHPLGRDSTLQLDTMTLGWRHELASLKGY